MGVSTTFVERTPFEIRRGDLTGAIGDTITTLPLLVALALLTPISLPHVLIAFGVFQIVWGGWYGLPISVEPMKALAALAIAGGLSYAELSLAGIVLGALLLAIGLTGTLGVVERWIGEPVVRGVQLAVALLLFETAIDLAVVDVTMAAVGVFVAAVVVVVGYRRSSAIAVLLVGVAIAIASAGIGQPAWPGAPPTPSLTGSLSWRTADGVFAQLAMTIGNAALATSLLVSDLFDRRVTPDRLSTSMGVTNLLAVPAGGIPMCHGCDGLAGKYAFGARTGGANMVLGVGYIALAVIATGAMIAAFPLAMLGVLLVIVAYSLGKHVLQSSNLPLSVGMGIVALLTNIGIAFLAGVLVHLALKRTTDRQ